MYHWGKHRQVNKEARTGNEISSSLSLSLPFDKHTNSLPTQGEILTYMRSIANEPNKKFGYMQISKESAVSLHHLFTARSITKQHHIICHITIKLQKGTSFEKKAAC